MRKILILFVTLSVAYGNAEAKWNPDSGTPSSYVEVANNTIYHHSGDDYAYQIQDEFIDKYKNELYDNPDTYIKIISHTDDVGDWETNLNTSKQRAVAVADYFSDVGVPRDRIILDWLGEDAPLFFKSEEKYKNARTNIRIVQKIKKEVRKEKPLIGTSNSSKKSLNAVIQAPSIPGTTTKQAQKANTDKKTKSKVKADTKPNPNWRRVAKEKRTTTVNKKTTAAEVQPTTRKILENNDLVAKGPQTVIRKSIIFVNEITNAPIQVEVDLTTLSGKVSVSTSSKGELNVDANNLKEKQVDVYAYGYFFKSVNVEDGNGQQIVKLQATDTGKKIELENLQFIPGKAILLKESDAELNRLYLSLMMNPKRKIEIGGHINVPGKSLREISSVQMQLSVDRAKSVYDYLINKGIPKKQLTYKGYGNSEMLFPEPKSETEKSKNRRVEVKIIE